MSIASIHSILADTARATQVLIRAHARRRSNAMTVRHLTALPAYLRRDVGLPDDADIAEVVERGLTRRAADDAARRDLTLLPHAV